MFRKLSLILLCFVFIAVLAFVGACDLFSSDSDSEDNGVSSGNEQNNDSSDDNGGTEPGEDVPGHIHMYSFTQTVAPDCAHDGYDLYVCACGKEQKRNVKPATGEHKYVKEVPHPATCKSDWYCADECEVCGVELEGSRFTVEGTKVDHGYVWTETVKADCKKTGSKDGVCRWCGVKKTEVIPMLAHELENYVLNNDATCTEDGTKTGICKMCGEKSTVTAEGTKLGHKCSDYVSNNDATCIKEGTLSGKCERCRQTVTIQGEKDPDGHAHNDFTVVKGTCGQQGTVSYRCIYCGNGVIADEVIQHSYDAGNSCRLCKRHMGWLQITENAVKTNDFLQPYVYIDVPYINGYSITYNLEIVMQSANGVKPDPVKATLSMFITDVFTGFSGTDTVSGQLWNYELGAYIPFEFKIAYSYSTKNDFVQFTVTGSGKYTDGSNKVHSYECDTELKIYLNGASHIHSYGDWMTRIGSCTEHSYFEKRCLLCSEKQAYDLGLEGHDFERIMECIKCGIKHPPESEGRMRVNFKTADGQYTDDFGLVYMDFKIKSIVYVGGDKGDRIEWNYKISFEMFIVQYYIENDQVKEFTARPAMKLDDMGWYGTYAAFKLFNVKKNVQQEFSGGIDGLGDIIEGNVIAVQYPVNSFYTGDYFGDHEYEAACPISLSYVLQG